MLVLSKGLRTTLAGLIMTALIAVASVVGMSVFAPTAAAANEPCSHRVQKSLVKKRFYVQLRCGSTASPPENYTVTFWCKYHRKGGGNDKDHYVDEVTTRVKKGVKKNSEKCPRYAFNDKRYPVTGVEIWSQKYRRA